MKFKKIIAVAMAAVSVLSLSACGAKTTTGGPSIEISGTPSSTVDEKETGEWDGIYNYGTIDIVYRGNSKKLTIPDTFEGEKVTGIQSISDAELEEIIIPDSVKTICGMAFQSCENLKVVKMGNGIENIEEDAFLCCTKLESVTFPENVVSIGENAFGGCTSLKEVNFTGNKLKEIKDYAFQDTALTEVMLPAGVETVGCAFINNHNISVWFPATVKEVGRFSEGDDIKLYGPAGSVVEQCAAENHNLFEVWDGDVVN